MNISLNNIGKETPKGIQLALQIVVVIGGVIAVAIQAAPEEYISLTLKNYILTVGAACATAIGTIASLLGKEKIRNENSRARS